MGAPCPFLRRQRVPGPGKVPTQSPGFQGAAPGGADAEAAAGKRESAAQTESGGAGEP